MSTRCLRTVTVYFTMTCIQLDQMGHQTMRTAWNGATIMTNVRDLLYIKANATLRVMNAGMISKMDALFFTQKQVLSILE